MPTRWEEAIPFLNQATPQKIDIGKATFQSMDGKTVTRYFINICDFGIGGAVVERVNRTTKLFGGKVSFL
ncbi:diacylglycerol kinase family lipid kinase, partial [Candidatus Saccharibacteria bacterium]|nr:diacylglycerol kinase family lipid kinase [Candidatus Saccharibacteria bacterium]NIW79090.1 diacylglycerol kinase family lipid kinase [Calditrichia bacterium]